MRKTIEPTGGPPWTFILFVLVVLGFAAGLYYVGFQASDSGPGGVFTRETLHPVTLVVVLIGILTWVYWVEYYD